MAVPPAPDEQSGVTRNRNRDLESEQKASSASRATRGRRLLALLLVGVILVCVGTLIYLFAARTDAADRSFLDRVKVMVSGNEDLTTERQEVLDLAQQFMLRVNTYGPADLDKQGQMPAFRDRVGSVITPKFKASFDQGVVAAEKSVAQAGVGRTAKVYGAGVSSIDSDSARVLVAGAFTVSYPNSEAKGAERVEVEPTPFRVEVSLVKIDGEWLVDDFVPVTGEEPDQQPSLPGTGSTPSASPTDEPTDSPSPSAPAPSAPTSDTPSGGGG